MRNDWRERHIRTSANGYTTVDICLDGLYDELVWAYACDTKPGKCWCLINPRHATVSSPTNDRHNDNPGRICFRCNKLLHLHELGPKDLIEVPVSPMQSRFYSLSTCMKCNKRILQDKYTSRTYRVVDTTHKLLEEYFPQINDPLERRPYGSSYSLELPVWVQYQLDNDKEERARRYLDICVLEHHISEVILDEVAGVCSCGSCGYSIMEYQNVWFNKGTEGNSSVHGLSVKQVR